MPNRGRPFQKTRAHGMTLLELLVAVAILAALAALAFPVFGEMSRRSKDLKCIANLRSAGTLVLGVAQENHGVFRQWFSGSPSGDESVAPWWTSTLTKRGILSSAGVAALRCPSLPADPNASPGNQNYGIYMADPEGKKEKVDGGYAYVINVMTHPRPANSLFMADSTDSAGTQQIRIFPSNSSFAAGAIHGRHGGAPHGFFLDGHIETMSRARLYELGVRRIYDENLRETALTAPAS